METSKDVYVHVNWPQTAFQIYLITECVSMKQENPSFEDGFSVGLVNLVGVKAIFAATCVF